MAVVRSGKTLVLGLVAAVVLAAPATASGAVTIGSPLTLDPSSSSDTCGTGTFTNTALAGGLLAPFDGRIVRWRIKIAAPGGSYLYALRVLQPLPGGSYRGDGSGPPQTAPSVGINTLTLTNPLLIKAGELVGVDCPNGAPSPSRTTGGGVPPTSTYAYWAPPLADGAQAPPTNQLPGEEVLVNADVAPIPPNGFTFGKVKKHPNKGTATLPVNLPGPGTVALSGKGLKGKQLQVSSTAKSAAQVVKLLIKAKGKAKGALGSSGHAKVKPSVTYTPVGEVTGVPNTLSRKIKLIKR
jgi:hypothetical protein